MSVSILIADDDNMIRSTLKKYFLKKTFNGTDYLVVSDVAGGKECIEGCRVHRPDVVLMDVDMPDMDGISATEKVLGEATAKCIIMLTSYDDPDTVSKAIEAGASGYLVKPISFSEVIPTIELGLSRSRDFYTIKKETDRLEKKIAGQSLINDAKLFLMEERGISEDEAYELMKGAGRERGISMEKVAGMILGKRRK